MFLNHEAMTEPYLGIVRISIPFSSPSQVIGGCAKTITLRNHPTLETKARTRIAIIVEGKGITPLAGESISIVEEGLLPLPYA